MTRDEAFELLERCRRGDERDPFPILTCMRQVFESAQRADRPVLNEVVRHWLVSGDVKQRFDAAWLTDELRIRENIDLVRQLRDEAELRDDPSAPFDWSKFNEIAGRLAIG